jgi:tetraacyldisaccharide 4'-kinase
MSNSNSHDAYFSIISGRRRDVGASLMRGLLWVLSLLYRSAVAVRRAYLRFAAERAEIPVISVGNLTVGGTGKTPLVTLLARRLAEMGHRPLVVSRGYKKTGDGPGDEAAAMRQQLSASAAHIESPDRAGGIRKALAQSPRDVAILDDGFQHMRLARDLDIVTIDATRPFGYGHVLPRGLLREPIAALRRADAVVITRSDQVTGDELDWIGEQIRANTIADTPVLRAVHAPTYLTTLDGDRENLDTLKDVAVMAFCGLANPGAFRMTLEGLGARVVGARDFADHHPYTAGDVAGIIKAARAAGARKIVTTGKDMVKVSEGDIAAIWPEDLRPVALEIEIRFSEGPDALDALLRQVVTAKK